MPETTAESHLMPLGCNPTISYLNPSLSRQTHIIRLNKFGNSYGRISRWNEQYILPKEKPYSQHYKQLPKSAVLTSPQATNASTAGNYQLLQRPVSAEEVRVAGTNVRAIHVLEGLVVSSAPYQALHTCTSTSSSAPTSTRVTFGHMTDRPGVPSYYLMKSLVPCATSGGYVMTKGASHSGEHVLRDGGPETLVSWCYPTVMSSTENLAPHKQHDSDVSASRQETVIADVGNNDKPPLTTERNTLKEGYKPSAGTPPISAIEDGSSETGNTCDFELSDNSIVSLNDVDALSSSSNNDDEASDNSCDDIDVGDSYDEILVPPVNSDEDDLLEAMEASNDSDDASEDENGTVKGPGNDEEEQDTIDRRVLTSSGAPDSNSDVALRDTHISPSLTGRYGQGSIVKGTVGETATSHHEDKTRSVTTLVQGLRSSGVLRYTIRDSTPSADVFLVEDAADVYCESSDVFSLDDRVLRTRVLVLLWVLLGDQRLLEVGFPQDPVHKVLWRTVDVCCSVAGVKSAAAIPLATDHDCLQDMTCFRDHAHRFLEVCAPAREHWKLFGWASLTVDAVVRKIYNEELLPFVSKQRSDNVPEVIKRAMLRLVRLESMQIGIGVQIQAATPKPPESVKPRIEVVAKKKRGRPAKPINKVEAGRIERVMLWKFLLNLLEDPRNAPCIHWVQREEGIFRILNTDWLARLWGRRHGNPRMTYEKMARAMRTYYRSKVLQPVPRTRNLPRKLVYKFNPDVVKMSSLKHPSSAYSGRGLNYNHVTAS